MYWYEVNSNGGGSPSSSAHTHMHNHTHTHSLELTSQLVQQTGLQSEWEHRRTISSADSYPPAPTEWWSQRTVSCRKDTVKVNLVIKHFGMGQPSSPYIDHSVQESWNMGIKLDTALQARLRIYHNLQQYVSTEEFARSTCPMVRCTGAQTRTADKGEVENDKLCHTKRR